MTVTIATTVTDPIVDDAAATGTNALAATVVVRFVDSAGTAVTAAAVIIGTTWSVADVDCSTLLDGAIVVTATETPTSGALTFAAKAATKRSVAPSHVTCQAWADHLDVRQAHEDISDGEIDAACWIASDMLYLLTGSRWPGVCVDKVWPQARYRQSAGPPRWWPSDGSSARWGWCSCNRGHDYGCTSYPEIKLPRGPVDPDSIVVTINGAPFTDFKLMDHRWLLRTDGEGWLCCQNPMLEDGAVGTWSIEYPWGALPDAGGRNAAAALGYQLALSYSGDQECRLPRRIQTITRGGTTIALIDPLTLLNDGLTGLTEVDLWLISKIVGNKRARATIGVVGKRPQYRRETNA